MDKCTDRVAIVTGAAGKGVGRSTALTLAREGAKVVVNYLTSQDSAAAIVRHIRDRGGQAVAVQADAFTADGCRKLVEAAVGEFGQVDICIVNPGAGWHPEPPEKLDADAALTDAHAELAPLYRLLPLILPGMYERKWGRIVGIALLRADSPSYAYDVAKAARTEALLQLRGRLRQHSVTVNVMAPGEFEHIPSLAAAIDQCEHGPLWQSRAALSPQDIAEGIAFLCSDAGRLISGAVLPYQQL
jgi:NAD(P)-dependent dehydrogenase (short-subunit alcohol dehydrogenase family)